MLTPKQNHTQKHSIKSDIHPHHLPPLSLRSSCAPVLSSKWLPSVVTSALGHRTLLFFCLCWTLWAEPGFSLISTLFPLAQQGWRAGQGRLPCLVSYRISPDLTTASGCLCCLLKALSVFILCALFFHMLCLVVSLLALFVHAFPILPAFFFFFSLQAGVVFV